MLKLKMSGMVDHMKIILAFLVVFLTVAITRADADEQSLVLSAKRLRMFVDELPHVPKVYGYKFVDGKPAPVALKIGMYHKKWVSSFSSTLFKYR